MNSTPLKVALIGATGFAGSEILKELSLRGHQVTALVRNTLKVPVIAGVTAQKIDLKNSEELTAVLRGHDAVISSVRFLDLDGKALIEAIKASAVKRYLVVGGAGSLEVSAGVRMLDTPTFPAAYKPEAQAGANFLDLLKKEPALKWSYLSPSAIFIPGKRTEEFRLGSDQLLVNERGDSKISSADFAIAFVNELEQNQHLNQRFTVGY
jgi:putative NADH-flavin reductase